METKKPNWLLKLVVVLSFVVMLTVNALSALLPLNGVTPQDVSAMYPNLFVPAGYTFSIWSIIYLSLLLFTLYQLGLFRGKKHPGDAAFLHKTAVVFSISSLANVCWLFAWHYGAILLSVVIMLLLLLSLIYMRLLIAKKPRSPREKLFVRLPFSLYFGWITVATIANVTALLVSVGWGGFGISDVVWTILVLAVGAIIGILTTLRFRDPAYALVLIWAYVGIWMNHTSAAGHGGAYPKIIFAIAVCIGLFAVALIFSLLKKKRVIK
jgi:hypothetical protein